MMHSPDTRAQLLASNLQYLVQYLAGAVPPMKAPTPAPIMNRDSSGGALFLTALA